MSNDTSPLNLPEPLIASIAALSDRELLEHTTRMAMQERGAVAMLVAHLAEMDTRRLYLVEGFSSLFTYCTQVLHLSENEAYNRIEVARAVRRFPVIVSKLASGSVHLTAVRLLAPVLTEENHGALLAEAQHKSKREVEEIVARVRPVAPVPAHVRRLPVQQAPEMARPIDGHRAPMEADNGGSGPTPRMEAAPGLNERTAPSPLAPGRYRVQFTASEAMHGRLRRAQELLRHQVPTGDISQILDFALVALLERVEARKIARRKRSRETSPVWGAGEPSASPGEVPQRRGPGRPEARESSSRHIPAAVRRAVWERDDGRCSFQSLNGRRCAETGFLEFHHVEPFACGGAGTVENIALRCRAHNQFEAVLHFGEPRIPGRKEVATRSGTSWFQADEGRGG